MKESHRSARAAFVSEAAAVRDGIANELMLAARATRPSREAWLQSRAIAIRSRWSRSLELYDAVVASMEQVSEQLPPPLDTDGDHRFVQQALGELNAAGTMVAREIGELLELAYIAGAGGRWRALHEISVSAGVIANCEPPIAERYLAHGTVVRIKRLERFWAQPHPDAPTDEERRRKLDEATRLSELHEPDDPASFAREYAWARPLLTRTKSGRRSHVTLSMLEQLADSGHRRLLVEASANSLVHADASSVRSLFEGAAPDAPIGSRSDQLHTIGVPALDSLWRLAWATNIGYAREFNDDARALAQIAVGIQALATRGIKLFRSDAKKHTVGDPTDE